MFFDLRLFGQGTSMIATEKIEFLGQMETGHIIWADGTLPWSLILEQIQTLLWSTSFGSILKKTWN
jgi:hypothetical protein